jgi:hypothetical protein
VKKQRIEYLSQEERNELGAAYAKGLDKCRVESWNNALAALSEQLKDSAKLDELVVVADVMTLISGLVIGEDEEGEQLGT